jgi:shikimate kinase
MSFEAWKERIPFIIDSRPVLHGKSEEDIKELFNVRKELYTNHHLKVTMDGKELEEIIDSIVHSLSLIKK